MKDEHALAEQLGIALKDLRQLATAPKTHYFYKTLRRQGKKPRKLRVPRPELMPVLHAIERRILDCLPLAPTMHGWRKRHSPKTYVRPHIHRRVILNDDIQDFFPSVTGGRVCVMWERLGYSPAAARLLTALTVVDNQLPQGSPTSQAIGNQVLRSLDRRLNRLATLHRLHYSNLADEFAISGSGRVRKLKNLAHKIVKQEGLQVNPEKTKVAQHHQRQELAGIVVNRKASQGRETYRTLRAIVNNSLRSGPRGQNRINHPNFRAHLQGRITQLRHINPGLGGRLWSDFLRINWST